LPGTAHVVGEGMHPDPGLGPHEADGSHKCAAHVIGLRAKEMLDLDPHCGFGAVALPGLPGQRLAPLALALNVAVQLPGFQHRSDPGPPIGGIRCPAGHCQVMSREGLT
jgi:hypothetical protein